MKKAAILALLTALAVQPMLGCCTCSWPPSSNPTPTPTPPPSVVVDPAYPSHKFAVLASNLKAEVDDNQLESDFWYDLVLTYCTLLEHGFDGDDIYVLFGDGSDATFSNYPAYKTKFCGDTVSTITDFSLQNSKGMAKDNLCNVLCCLSSGRPATLIQNTQANDDECKCLEDSDTGIGGFTCSQPGPAKLRSDDFLFVWVKGHGKTDSGTTDSCMTTLRFTPDPHLYDHEVETMLNGLDPKRRTLVFETCDAGGWLDNLENGKTAVAVSSGDPKPPSTCKETAYSVVYDEIPGDQGGVFHGRFTHGFNAALRHMPSATEPVDEDDNNLISIQEGFDEAKKRIDAENALYANGAAEYGGAMHPAIRLEDDIAQCLFIRLPNPGADVEVFTKDHPEDNAIVSPATSTEDTPDLWVSGNPSCAPKAELIQKGVNHHLCARVHNIGCDDPGGVTVKFTITSSANPGPPTETDVSGSILDLPRATSAVVPASWTPETPGIYSIRAELTAGTDSPVSDLNVMKDNNKAQIEITVVP